MDKFLVILPYIYLAIYTFFALLLTNGIKYSIKKTLLISIPLLALIITINVIVYMNIDIDIEKLNDTIFFLFASTMYIPIALLVLFVGKKKYIGYVTSGVNIFLAYYFIALSGKLIIENTKQRYIIYIWFLLVFPISLTFIRIIYKKL